MVDLIIRGHPAQRMTQRGITEEDIKAALADCNLHRAGDGGSWRHEGRVGERTLIVVTVEQQCTGTLTIKTVMWKGSEQ